MARAKKFAIATGLQWRTAVDPEYVPAIESLRRRIIGERRVN